MEALPSCWRRNRARVRRGDVRANNTIQKARTFLTEDAACLSVWRRALSRTAWSQSYPMRTVIVGASRILLPLVDRDTARFIAAR